jgi:hypothetical protein
MAGRKSASTRAVRAHGRLPECGSPDGSQTPLFCGFFADFIGLSAEIGDPSEPLSGRRHIE